MFHLFLANFIIMDSNTFKLFLYLILSILFGPLLLIYFTIYGDFYTLSKTYPIFDIITEEWLLLLGFFLFWMGAFFTLSFWNALRKFINMPKNLDWWQKGVIYQIYVRTFKDSNNDGIGDLHGIIQKLDYLKKIGVKSIWLNPIYPSGGKDGGYDITSFVDIDPDYGTMKDFEELVDKVHSNGMKLLMDLVPNHTSDQHQWFKESCKNNNPNNSYRDYYVWHPSQDKSKPPNNWLSVFGDSAWTYNETRKAWYLHQFLPEQPDLNYRCQSVHIEMKKVLKFWLETKKVDGFRIDALKHLYESENFEDEPVNKSIVKDLFNKELTYDDFDHIHTSNLKETFDVLNEWRAFCDDISRRTQSSKALIVEATYDVKHISQYYKYKNRLMAHFPFNFQFCSIKQKSPNEQISSELSHLSKTDRINRSFTPQNLKRLIEEYQNHLPKGCWPNWQLGNHDNPRISSRVGRENIDLANVLNLLLGGTAVVYYGEEIGMEDLPKNLLKFEDCKDGFGLRFGSNYLSYTRDPARTPMQWNALENAGFTDKNIKPWLPVNPIYVNLNVEKEQADKKSHLKVFTDLMELRDLPSFQWGELKLLVVNEQIFSFLRRAYDYPTYLIVMNISDKNANVNLQVNTDIAPRAYVTYYIPGNKETLTEPNSIITNNNSDSNYKDIDLNETYKPNAPVLSKNVFLKGHDCLILNWYSPN